MKLFNSGGQQAQHYVYKANGALAAGGAPQLVLARSKSRSSLIIHNTSTGPLYFELDFPEATAAITSGAVSGVTVNNAGFNYTRAPKVFFLGGGNQMLAWGSVPNSLYLGLNQPNGESPTHQATGHCVMTGSPGNLSISSIVVDDGGSGYASAPYVLIENDLLDPYGTCLPVVGSSFVLPAGAWKEWNGTTCPTGPVSIIGPTTGQTFKCWWMD